MASFLYGILRRQLLDKRRDLALLWIAFKGRSDGKDVMGHGTALEELEG
jgi:hypothetical protein